MSNTHKAYLVDIKTKAMKNNYTKDNTDKGPMYEHTGIFSFNDRYILAALDLDPYNSSPCLVGNIADINYVCSIECHEPLKVCFNAIPQSEIIKSKLKSFPTQIQAFEDAVKTTIQYLQHQESINPKSLEYGDSLSNFSETKVKTMAEAIQSKEVPCSSYFYNVELKTYVFRKYYFQR
jgi:hypothetical protein